MDNLHLLFARQDDASSGDAAADPAADPAAALPVFTKDPAPVVIPAIWIMLAIASVFLVLRVYCRVTKAKMWWDDYILITGWVFLLCSTALITRLMVVKFGMTLFFTPYMHAVSTSNDVLNKVALALTKTSFAVTLLRVAQGWQKWLIWFLIGSMNIILAVNCVTTWMAACERQAAGDTYAAVLPNTCWRVQDSVMMALVANGYSALVDFILALLPWKIIMSLQMKKHEKIGVAIAMSLGLVAGIVGVMKVVHITSINGGEDIPYRLSLLFIWGQAEPCATIVASSIPVLRVLFRDTLRSKYGYGASAQKGYLRSNDHSKFPNSVTMMTLEDGKHNPDDGSDRSILQNSTPTAGAAPQLQGKSSIMRTREIAIEYDERSRSAGSQEGGEAFEMRSPHRTSVPPGYVSQGGVPRAL